MNFVKEIKGMLRDKNGKKLALLSFGVFVLIAAIVFFAAFKLCENIYIKQMNDYLGEIPGMIESSRKELDLRGRIYDDDVLTRAELGLKIYREGGRLSDQEKLERVRGAVSADSVSLVDGQRQVLFTTGAVSPEEHFRACLQTLEERKPKLELYPAAEAAGEETWKNDGRGFVILPVPDSGAQSLVFEFTCDTMLEMYNALNDWSVMLGQLFSSGDIAAYAKSGDSLTGYPMDDLTPEEVSLLQEDLEKVFQSSDSFRSTENGGLVRIVTLLVRRYLAALAHDPKGDTDLLLTVPLRNVIRNAIFIAASIAAIIALGMVLLQVYVFRRLQKEKEGKGKAAFSLRQVCRTTWPGLFVVLAVTLVFSSMLLLLEARSNAAFFAVNNRESLENEIEWRRSQEETIRGAFKDFYRTRTQTLAAYLTDHPDEQTRAGLEELSRIAGSQYLMRFDRDGRELVSSNSYTGFAVGENLSEEYRAVLMGYPNAVVGPETDPYTDQSQIGVAILMTDRQGRADGFLLAVYSAGDLSAELKRMRPEYTVNHFETQKGHCAAIINDKDGTFIAHTDPKMIGIKAEDVLEAVQPGSGFEGFTMYGRQNVYVSASAADGRTLLYLVSAAGDAYARKVAVVMFLAVMLILVLLYYPAAGALIAGTVRQAKETAEAPDNQKNPLLVFLDGYVVFLTLFVIFALVSSANGWWTSFDYVFCGQWSKGLHLFSLWGALFVLVVTLFCLFVIRNVLSLLEKRLSLRAKTMIRLAGSLITYVAIIFLAFCILGMFGVNTTALMASAGIISIAVGMGAQSMAADLLAGFFMMLEGSVRVGDHVTIGGVTGHVTDMGIRTTEITDADGNVVVFNNSKMTGLINRSRKKEAQEDEPTPEKES